MPIEKLEIDLDELEWDRRKNLEERREFLGWYAEWLRARGIVRHDPVTGQGRAPDKPAKGAARRKGR